MQNFVLLCSLVLGGASAHARYDMIPGMTITHKGTIRSADGKTKNTLVVQTITARTEEKISRHMKLYDVTVNEDGIETQTLTQEFDDEYAPKTFWIKSRIKDFLKQCRKEGRMGRIKVGKKTFRGCPHSETFANGASLVEWVGKVPFGNLHSEFTSKDGSVQIYDYAGTTYARP